MLFSASIACVPSFRGRVVLAENRADMAGLPRELRASAARGEVAVATLVFAEEELTPGCGGFPEDRPGGVVTDHRRPLRAT